MDISEQLLLSLLGFVLGIFATSSVCFAVFQLSKAKLANSVEGSALSRDWRLRANYWERYAKILTQCDPSSLLVSEKRIKSYIRNAVNVISQRETQEGLKDLRELPTKEEQLRRSLLIESAVRPGSHEIVPSGFRMGGYLPFNGPVCVALAMSRSLPTFLFWSWLNQSQAALVNLFNLSSANGNSMSILFSYTLAVSCALLSSMGIINFVSNNLSLNPEEKEFVMSILPVPTNALAAIVNCYMMSRDLLTEGIGFMNEGKDVKSKVAARKAVMQTMITRALLPLPCFLFPSIIFRSEFVQGLCGEDEAILVVVDVFTTSFCFGVGLPAALAVFPEFGVVNRDKVEPEVRENVQNKLLIYNRGL